LATSLIWIRDSAENKRASVATQGSGFLGDESSAGGVFKSDCTTSGADVDSPIRRHKMNHFGDVNHGQTSSIE
jgi:hypothetical protein